MSTISIDTELGKDARRPYASIPCDGDVRCYHTYPPRCPGKIVAE